MDIGPHRLPPPEPPTYTTAHTLAGPLPPTSKLQWPGVSSLLVTVANKAPLTTPSTMAGQQSINKMARFLPVGTPIGPEELVHTVS